MKSIRTQADLILEGLDIIALYKRDKIDFQLFNPVRFVAAFGADFQEAIDQCMDINDDETMVDLQVEKTADIEMVMEKARKNYARIKYFVEEAFPDNERRRNLLGADTYNDARKSVANMIIFLSNMNRQTGIYQTQLLAAGCSAVLIDEILTLRDELIVANTDQSTSKGDRSITTQERVSRFDALEDYIRAVCRVGKLVFEGNEAKFKQYLRFKSSTTTTAENTSIEKNTISANGDVLLLTNKFKTTDYVEVENTGTTEFSVYISDAIENPIPSSAVPLMAGVKFVYSPQDFAGTTAKSIIVHNNGQAVGNVRAAIMVILEESS
jgi:hypothetical protein